MGTSLIVGHLPDESAVTFVSNFVKNAFVSVGVEQSLQSFLGRFLSKSPLDQKVNSLILEWKTGPAEVGYLDTLNEASVVAFLEFTAKLEGTSSEEAIENSKWKNLPYWLQSIWLPLESINVDPVVVEIEGMPTLIGSATGLVNDLEAIAAAAKIGLKKKPSNFDLMISDPKAFYALKVADLNQETTLMWIWNSYYEGAKLSLLHNRPLCRGDDEENEAITLIQFLKTSSCSRLTRASSFRGLENDRIKSGHDERVDSIAAPTPA